MKEQENALTVAHSQTPGFLSDATSSLEKMEAYAGLLIKSGLVPKHFYQLDTFRNPIKDPQGNFVGNTSAVIMTIQHGFEVGMSISQALQQIVPVNGLMSIKGDGAKALIMNSGLCSKWEETEVGARGSDTFGVMISAARKDGQTMTRTFTVADAKRAGLWITDEMAKSNDKLMKSAWYKFGPRMLRYRCLGFIARDLFADVLQGMYTEEEARDVHEDNTTYKTDDGMTVKLNDERGKTMNGAAASAAGKKEAVSKEPVPPVKAPKEEKEVENKAEHPATEEESISDAVVIENNDYKVFTVEELKGMGGKSLLEVLDERLGIKTSDVLFVGENKPKKVVGWIAKLILSYQAGTIKEELKKSFGYEWEGKSLAPVEGKENKPQDEVYRIGEVVIGEPTEAGRTLEEIMKISDYVKRNKLDKAKVMEYVEVQCLGFENLEAFYRHGSAKDIYRSVSEFTTAT